MNDDVRRFIYGTLVVFVIGLLVWFGFLYVNSCGFTFTCNKARLLVDRTPIPTIGYAPVPAMEAADPSGKCKVFAVELMGAWVSAGSPESESFSFSDIDGEQCEGNYNEDVRPLFVDANIWYAGSFSCASCHSPDIAGTSAAKLERRRAPAYRVSLGSVLAGLDLVRLFFPGAGLALATRTARTT